MMIDRRIPRLSGLDGGTVPQAVEIFILKLSNKEYSFNLSAATSAGQPGKLHG